MTLYTVTIHYLISLVLSYPNLLFDGYFDASMLSDGTLRFICLCELLLQPVPPGLIIIDEPELGLHPYAVTLLASMIQSASVRSQATLWAGRGGSDRLYGGPRGLRPHEKAWP